jgi:hypothetical protein
MFYLQLPMLLLHPQLLYRMLLPQLLLLDQER